MLSLLQPLARSANLHDLAQSACCNRRWLSDTAAISSTFQSRGAAASRSPSLPANQSVWRCKPAQRLAMLTRLLPTRSELALAIASSRLRSISLPSCRWTLPAKRSSAAIPEVAELVPVYRAGGDEGAAASCSSWHRHGDESQLYAQLAWRAVAGKSAAPAGPREQGVEVEDVLADEVDAQSRWRRPGRLPVVASDDQMSKLVEASCGKLAAADRRIQPTGKFAGAPGISKPK